MKINTEYHVTVRCTACGERTPRTGGRLLRRVKLKGGCFMTVNCFYCAQCVEAGRHTTKKKGEGDGK